MINEKTNLLWRALIFGTYMIFYKVFLKTSKFHFVSIVKIDKENQSYHQLLKYNNFFTLESEKKQNRDT